MAVTPRHRSAGQIGFLQAEEIDEKVLGSCGQCLDGSDHCQLGGGDDTVGVYFFRAGFTDAHGQGAKMNFFGSAFALQWGELLAVVDVFQPRGGGV